MEVFDLVAHSYELGKRVLETRETNALKEHGQFLTPPSVARYMAKQLDQIQDGACLLEPTVGSGVLVCAVIERLIGGNRPLEVSITAYETDKELADVTREVLKVASKEAEKKGIRINWQVYQEDFIFASIAHA